MDLTFTVQSLSDNSPQQRATVVTEGGRLVVVDVELMRNINAEALGNGLQRHDTVFRYSQQAIVCFNSVFNKERRYSN